MAGRMLKVGVGWLVSSALLAGCDGLPGGSNSNGTSDTSGQIVQQGTTDGAAWQLRAKRGDQVCVELIQVEPRRTAAQVCPQSKEDPDTGEALRYSFGSITSGAKARSFVVVAFGIAGMRVARVTIDFAGKSLDGTTKKATGFASSQRYFAIPLETIPEGGVKAISALDESGNTVASFGLTPGATSPGPPGGSPSPTGISTSPAGATPTATSTTRSAVPSGATPWSAEPLAQSKIPKILLVEWGKAKNRTTCSPLFPDALGEGDGGRPRRANFSGGWAIAYDKSGLPGRLRSGEPCKDCGRGVFGIAGTGTEIKTPEELDPNNALPLEKRWSDGSRVDYGLEGGTGPSYLATLFVKGEGCVYNVWSFIGQAHLEHLLDHLRYVQAGTS
jgi:hypothetical protein